MPSMSRGLSYFSYFGIYQVKGTINLPALPDKINLSRKVLIFIVTFP